MESSAKFYTSKVVRARDSFFRSYKATDDTTKQLILKAVGHLNKNKSGKLLDIGTGNGYVLSEVCKLLKNILEKEMVGVDLSKEMVKEAQNRNNGLSQIKIIQGDNYELPFADNYFDVVTNKLATNFSFSEVFRVLKKGGLFIFKEYGLFKGFGGITEIFESRMKITDPLQYLELLRGEKPHSFSYTQYYFDKKYGRKEIVDIFSMAPIIKDFDPQSDMKKMDKLFASDEVSVVADPFLITAIK